MSKDLTAKITSNDARQKSASWGHKLIDKGYPRIGGLFVALGERDFDKVGSIIMDLFSSDTASDTERKSFEQRYGVDLDALLYQTAIDTTDREESHPTADN